MSDSGVTVPCRMAGKPSEERVLLLTSDTRHHWGNQLLGVEFLGFGIALRDEGAEGLAAIDGDMGRVRVWG